MDNMYYKWLLAQLWDDDAEVSESFISDYSYICKNLFCIPFDGFENPDDRNRAEDGLYLRRQYYRETGNSIDIDTDNATVLEVLVAFCLRIESEYTGDSNENLAYEILIMFIENLGLNELSPISEVIEDWFAYKLSIFIPENELDVDNFMKNKPSLWTQMMLYVANIEE